MAANAILCIDNSDRSIDFNGLSLMNGQIITATDQSPAPDVVSYCVVITDGDQPGGSLTATTDSYTSCYDCLVNNYTTVRISPCDGTLGLPDTIDIDIAQFGFIPIENQVLYLQFTNTGRTYNGTWVGCYRVEGVTQNTEADYPNLDLSTIDQIIYNNFSIANGCDECLNGFSAGTESELCKICWDGSGYTTTVVSAPHPKWTNQFGQTVTLLDAIQLGGMNGLNN